MTAALAILTGCERPTSDPAKLRAIKAEAQLLMRIHPRDAKPPKAQWPQQIASLEPEFMMISADGVHVETRAYFDGGWGYSVPRKAEDLPDPVGRFEEAGHGVYGWHP
jgi:hypothetical protein